MMKCRCVRSFYSRNEMECVPELKVALFKKLTCPVLHCKAFLFPAAASRVREVRFGGPNVGLTVY